MDEASDGRFFTGVGREAVNVGLSPVVSSLMGRVDVSVPDNSVDELSLNPTDFHKPKLMEEDVVPDGLGTSGAADVQKVIFRDVPPQNSVSKKVTGKKISKCV